MGLKEPGQSAARRPVRIIPVRGLGWLLRAFLAALLGGAAATVAAAPDTLLTGELGRWIDTEAAPELGETLSRHPRFSGATVRLTTVVPGAAPGQSNRLAAAIERRLRQRLLEIDGVRLAVDRPQRGCAAPPAIDYLVRIEASPVGSRSLRVHVAVVDVAESVWVSGISHQWQGRLSSAERAALAEPVGQTGVAGSATSPIPLDDARAVAAAMKADLACLLPGGLDGALFVETPPRPPLARVSLALQSELSFAPLAALTADRAAARWVLSLKARDATADVHELSLDLAAAEGGEPQRVASVFVAGALPAPPTAASPAVPPAPVPPAAPVAPAAPGGLLSALTVTRSAPEGICDHRKARVNSCVEVDFALQDPAYLFVISTSGHALSEVSCGRLERSDPGPRRFRIRVPPGGYAARGAAAGPDAGFYVLAVKRRALAARLRVVLASAPGQCGSRERSTARWHDELAALLARDAGDIAWQAVHLVHGRDGIVAL